MSEINDAELDRVDLMAEIDCAALEDWRIRKLASDFDSWAQQVVGRTQRDRDSLYREQYVHFLHFLQANLPLQIRWNEQRQEHLKRKIAYLDQLRDLEQRQEQEKRQLVSTAA
jgi:uncharacterized phage-like protein YoqJ